MNVQVVIASKRSVVAVAMFFETGAARSTNIRGHHGCAANDYLGHSLAGTRKLRFAQLEHGPTGTEDLNVSDRRRI
jgi:hypothetical protein